MKTDVMPGGGSIAESSSLLAPIDAYPVVTLDDVHAAEVGLIALAKLDLASRPFRLMRAELLKTIGRTGHRVIGITSAAPGAGKTFVTCNLALALAKASDQPVYLFDLDLRRPSIASRFGIDIGDSLTDFLEGRLDNLATVGIAIEGTQLIVFGASQCVEPSEILIGARFKELVAAIHALPSNAIVLCDLPPAFVGDDAVNAINALGAYLHIVEDGVTPVRQLEEVRSLLDPAPCVGTILNRYAGRLDDSYGYGAQQRYRSYYETDIEAKPSFFSRLRTKLGRPRPKG